MPSQNGPGSYGNEGVLCIPQSPSIIGTSLSDCLVSYQDTHWLGLSPLQTAVGVFYSSSQLGNKQIIFIIIMPRYHHRYPWPSLANPPYRPLLPAGPQGYIPYLHRAAVCRFKLVFLPLHVNVKGSTGVHHLWPRPYFSSSVPHVWFI